MIAILMAIGYLACVVALCLIVVPRLFQFTDEEGE